MEQTGPVIPDLLYRSLNEWRTRLFYLQLIGVNEQGIGFGNLSIRLPGSRQFFITGTATGKFEKAGKQHYTMVKDYSFSGNSVTCTGPLRASSESLSHAAIYESDRHTQTVIHIHHRKMWEDGKNLFPVTDPSCGFGTPDMAFEIGKQLRDGSTRKGGVLIMGGHPEGILFFGQGPEEAGKKVLSLLESISPTENSRDR